MKVQTRTKISAWAVIGEKEKINLDLCDFSPEQVAELDRLIRADGENKVEITIEPEQKKLQIEPIRSVVKLVSLACRTGGQKLTVSGFRSPDERATAIKRLSAAETPILLTVQEVQMTMFDRAKREAESPALPAGSLGETPHEEDLNLACRGMKGACVEAVIECVGPGKWSLIGVARLGNYHYQTRDVGETDVAFSSRRACIDALRLKLGAWLDNIEPAGTAAQKKSLIDRRRKMKGQIDEWLNEAAIDPESLSETNDDCTEVSGEDGDGGVPFEEDDSQGDEATD